MRTITKLLLAATMPMIATGCHKSVEVENVTVANDTGVDANAVDVNGDGMINYAATNASDAGAGNQQ